MPKFNSKLVWFLLTLSIIASIQGIISNKLYFSTDNYNHGKTGISFSQVTVPNPPEASSYEVPTIPKHIFMIWDSGWDSAPLTAILARKSWQLQNPNHTVWALDLAQVEVLINRTDKYPNELWDVMSIAAKSDVLRVHLLHKFGGIWVDASVFCTKPLLSWMDHDQNDFVTFNNVLNEGKDGIQPWITSWFMAARTNSYVMDQIYTVVTDPDEFYRFTNEYFWLHRIVSELENKDDRIVTIIWGLEDWKWTENCVITKRMRMQKRCGSSHWADYIWELEKKQFPGELANKWIPRDKLVSK